MPPSDQVQYQATTIRDLLANTTPEQLDNATPCSQWTVRDLANHMVGGGTAFGQALKGEPMEMFEGPMPDLLGDDPVAAWDGAVKTFSEGIDSPGALERDVALPFGTFPGSVVLEIAKVDLLVHAWDLATATGQPFDPPADIVEPAIGAAQMIIQPPARDGDTFKDEITPASDAAPIERLVAFTGREV